MTFDEVINRRATESYKWREYPEDVLFLLDSVGDSLKHFRSAMERPRV